jgi:hypothetical protein
MAKKKRSAKKSVRYKSAKKKGRKKGAKRKAAKRKVHRPEPGFKRRRKTGIFVPVSYDDGEVVKPSLIEKGIAEAKSQIRDVFYDMAEALGDDFYVKGMELEVSFNADGKFLGLGVGGATSIKVSVGPAE